MLEADVNNNGGVTSVLRTKLTLIILWQQWWLLRISGFSKLLLVSEGDYTVLWMGATHV
jgi:hypothetical protein